MEWDTRAKCQALDDPMLHAGERPSALAAVGVLSGAG
jgi:hypothetical protein